MTIDPTSRAERTADVASAAAPSAAEHARLRVLAAQFESLLMGQMMQQMRGSMLGGDDDEHKSSGFGGGALADAMYSELSLALSRAGGIGVASAVLPPLLAQADNETTATPGLMMPAGVDLQMDTASGSIAPAAAAAAVAAVVSQMHSRTRVTSSHW